VRTVAQGRESPMTSAQGIVLFVHGARDPRWAEPFERLRDRVATRAPHARVALAFLEHGTPTLAQAAAALAGQGVRSLRVVPLFFGRGGHLRSDFPAQLDAAYAAAPGVAFEITQAAGEDDAVQEALARFALDAPAQRHAR
jgi:sirohydrochlorin cobaltochelatase